MPVTKHY